MAKGDDSGIGGGSSGSGGTGAAGGAGNKGPVGTPQNPAPNGYIGPVDGKDITDTLTLPPNTGYWRGNGAKQIEAAMDAQGFRNKPQLVKDKAEFDKMVSQAWNGNGLLLYRGYGAPDAQTLKDYKDSLRSGEWYVTCGGGAAHGYGMYANYMYGGKPDQSKYNDSMRYANRYGSHTKLEEMTLHPSAKIGEESQLRTEMRQFNKDQQKKAIDPIIAQLKNGTRAEKAVARRYEKNNDMYDVLYSSPSRSASTTYRNEYHAATDRLQKALNGVKEYQDVGVYATAKGYDFYYDRSSGYSVVLNRSKLVIYDG